MSTSAHRLVALSLLNTLRPRKNGRHFADDMFKCIFLNVNVWIPIEISLTFVPKGSLNNNPALFQMMARRRSGDKPLSEPIMVSSLTHICVTRPQWVNHVRYRCLSVCSAVDICPIGNLVVWIHKISTVKYTSIWVSIMGCWTIVASCTCRMYT